MPLLDLLSTYACIKICPATDLACREVMIHISLIKAIDFRANCYN